jgi:CRP-like cAMP-binding protein
MTYQFASVRRVAPSVATEVQPNDPFVTRLSSIDPLTLDQARIVAAIHGPPRRVPARTQFARAGNSPSSAYVVRAGWAFGYTLLANGERQVVGFLLPGDILRPGCPARGTMELGVETITDTIVSEISIASVRKASQEWPEVHLIFLRLQWDMLAALVGQLTDIGRRDARARVAQFLLKLERRLMIIGQARPDGYYCPISQYLIADALGLTAIHVNRVLRSLREQHVVTMRNNRVTIHNRARLRAIAGDEADDSDDGAEVVTLNAGRRDGALPIGNRSRASL